MNSEENKEDVSSSDSQTKPLKFVTNPPKNPAKNPPKVCENPGNKGDGIEHRPKISPREAGAVHSAVHTAVQHKRPLHKQLG